MLHDASHLSPVAAAAACPPPVDSSAEKHHETDTDGLGLIAVRYADS
jgi:hypothetical protein